MPDSSDRSPGTGRRAPPRGRHAALDRARALVTQRLVEGEARVVVEGPPGSGKTSLLRALERRAPPDVEPRFVPFVNVEPEELEAWLAGLDAAPSPRGSRTVWLLVDEAQGIPPETAARLAELAAEPGAPMRLVLAGTSGRPLEGVVHALGAPAARIRIEAGLDAEEVEALARAWAEARGLPRERLPDADALLRETEGWPGPLALALEQRLFALEEEAARPGARRPRSGRPRSAPRPRDPETRETDPASARLARLSDARRTRPSPADAETPAARGASTRAGGFAPLGPRDESERPGASARPDGERSARRDGEPRASLDDAAGSAPREEPAHGLAGGLLRGAHPPSSPPDAPGETGAAREEEAPRAEEDPAATPRATAEVQPPARAGEDAQAPPRAGAEEEVLPSEGAAHAEAPAPRVPRTEAAAPGPERPAARAPAPAPLPRRAAPPSRRASAPGTGRRPALVLAAVALVALVLVVVFATRESPPPAPEIAVSDASPERAPAPSAEREPAPPDEGAGAAGPSAASAPPRQDAPPPPPPDPLVGPPEPAPATASAAADPTRAAPGPTTALEASTPTAPGEEAPSAPPSTGPSSAGPPESASSEDADAPPQETAAVSPPPQEPATAGTAADPVRVNINVRPWAQVFVDGEALGTTPLADVPLAPGGHDVRAVLPDGREILTRVEVDAETRFISLP